MFDYLRPWWGHRLVLLVERGSVGNLSTRHTPIQIETDKKNMTRYKKNYTYGYGSKEAFHVNHVTETNNILGLSDK